MTVAGTPCRKSKEVPHAILAKICQGAGRVRNAAAARPADPGVTLRHLGGRRQAAANAVAKANAFLDSLDAKQREKALFAFYSAKRPQWSNLPITFVPRNGVALGEMTKPQRAAALELLAAVLSKEGYQKCIDIMNADDQIIKDKENKMKFGTEHFYLALFGKPSKAPPQCTSNTGLSRLSAGGYNRGFRIAGVGRMVPTAA